MLKPVRQKNLGKLSAKAKFNNAEEIILSTLADRKIIEYVPQKELLDMLTADASNVSPTPVSGLYAMYLDFQYQDPNVLKDFNFGNVLVEAHLPYCLHIPNFYEMEISIPEQSLEALVIFRKIWTKRARDERGQPSSKTDFFAEDRALYFKNSIILTPKIPLDPEEGWSPRFTGTNIEKMSDQSGVFRYTKVYIQFDHELSSDSSEKKLNEKLLGAIREKALTVMNRVIDNYRDTTKEAYIRRLGELPVNLIYLIPKNRGVYVLPHSIEGAKMNEAGQDIETISDKLSKGEKPEVYKLLLLDALNSFETKDYTLAIVESFQALEIFLEAYLISAFKKRGDPETQYMEILNKNWATKQRLTTVLKELKGVSLNEEQKMWDPWCARYDKTRNEVIHAGKESTGKETKETIDINEAVIEWLKSK